MRKLTTVLICFIFIFLASCPVSAASGVTGGSFSATVSPDGDCQVTLDLQLHLESGNSDLAYPLPGNATNITLNGNPARISRSGSIANVKLSSVLGNVTGDFTVRLQYTLPNAVAYDDSDKLMLTLPLLSGFQYPIQGMDFLITLPGEFDTRPHFYSGYYQQTIESNLKWTISGNIISGTVLGDLKDRETLVMTLGVTDALFPQNPVSQWKMGVEEILMIAAAALALIYWIIYLRCAPFLRRHSTTPPEGFTAGEFSSLLAGHGNNLTMMVFSWAQMGYILIHVQDSGRVTLHKRMEMGNERDPAEVRIFRSLFGKRRFIDGTGYHYALLCKKTAASQKDTQNLYKRSSGNPKVFRILCALIGLLGGISLGRAIVGSALLGILLIAVLAVLGAVSAWVMQDWVMGLHLNDKTALLLGLGLALLWCLLGLAAGILNVTASVAGAQLLCGLASGYGGRRTVIGRQNVTQTLGLRHYLKHLSAEEAHRISRSDPEYFFTMAPYAIALGVNKHFAKSFKGKRFSSCPYLTTGMDGHMTASEWAHAMERAVQALDARQKRLFLERLIGR